jgi:hypothetical protein
LKRVVIGVHGHGEQSFEIEAVLGQLACRRWDFLTDAPYFDADRNAWDAFSETSKARDEACRESGQSSQSICVVAPVFVSLEVREKFQPCVWLVLNVTSLLSHSSTA